MPDYTLTAPDGTEYVTGDGSERARLLGRGYREVTKQSTRRSESSPIGQKPAEPTPAPSEPKSPPKPEVRNDSK